VAAATLLAVVATGCTGTEQARPGPSPSPSPAAPVPELRVTLAKVKAHPVRGNAKTRRLRPQARRVRDVMAGLYSAGFVSPEAWAGRFGPAVHHFRGLARRHARRDLDRLTLGTAAGQVNEVRPARSKVRVHFLVGRNRRPAAAMARMTFAGRADTVDGVESRLRHEATYLLRPKKGRWKVEAYRVGRRLAPRSIPGVPLRGSRFILVLGSDARPGEPVDRTRADSIHVIGVNLRKGRASVLGIPRDSYVPIPGRGSQKINAALFLGGAPLMVRTVEQLTGIRMDGYVLTGFHGFESLVDRIGGVKVRVPYRMADSPSGAYFRPGTTRMKGRDALAFNRNRKGAPGGDFGRSLNQGTFLVAALRELRRDVRRDPVTLLRWIASSYRHVQTDLSPIDMLELGVAALTIKPKRVRNVVVSGGGGSVGGASVVRLGGSAHAAFRDLRDNGMLGR
jgi:LCP family protein required for cell wall assembly